MASKVKPVQDGHHTVVPYLILSNAAEAIEFYKKAFDAVDQGRMAGPGGQGIIHAEIRIGDSLLYLADEFPGMGNPSPQTLGGSPVSIHLNVEDIDSVFARAIESGARPLMPPADMFWGDRFGKLTDPFGHSWSLSTHIEDLTPEQMEGRTEAALAQMATKKAVAAGL